MPREMLSRGNGIREWTDQHRHNEAVKTRFVDALIQERQVSAIVLTWYNIP